MDMPTYAEIEKVKERITHLEDAVETLLEINSQMLEEDLKTQKEDDETVVEEEKQNE